MQLLQRWPACKWGSWFRCYRSQQLAFPVHESTLVAATASTPNAERAFDCVRANNVWSSQATERSPLSPLRCERWQAAWSKPIELKEHLSEVLDRSVCSAIRQHSFKGTQVLCGWKDNLYMPFDTVQDLKVAYCEANYLHWNNSC